MKVRNIAEVVEQIERMRDEVSRSLEADPFELAYAKNKELDVLIEQYLDAVDDERSTIYHLSPPPIPTIE